MSRVKIVIDGATWGFDVTPERMANWMCAMNEVSVRALINGPQSKEASEARTNAREAFEHIISEISFGARKTA